MTPYPVSEETLDGDEKPTCSRCKERTKAVKWYAVERWPRVLLVEQILATPETDPVALAVSHGYEIKLDTRRNVVLELSI